MENMTYKEFVAYGKKMKRRANMLYKLRKQGITCDTKTRTIYFPVWGGDPLYVGQIKRLCKEFRFRVQLIIE
jgi:hypothetical protein